jgi:hypothetical protein
MAGVAQHPAELSSRNAFFTIVLATTAFPTSALHATVIATWAILIAEGWFAR